MLANRAILARTRGIAPDALCLLVLLRAEDFPYIYICIYMHTKLFVGGSFPLVNEKK